MRKFATLGAVVALGISGAAMAASPSYSYVEGGYGYSELAGGFADGDGFVLGASVELPANFVLAASYRDFSYDGAGGITGDLSEITAGIAYKWNLSESFDFLAGANFEQLDDGDSISGFSLGLGTRGRITDTVELNVGLKYHDMESAAGPTWFSASLGLRKYFNPKFAGGLDVRKGGLGGIDETSFIASLRYDFGDLY